jgi:hypothetical protein
MSSAAERQARKRAGRVVVPVEVNREDAMTLLVITGHLAERDMENLSALSAAMGTFFSDQAGHRKIQRMKAAVRLPIDKEPLRTLFYHQRNGWEDLRSWCYQEGGGKEILEALSEELEAERKARFKESFTPLREGDNRPIKISDLPAVKVEKRRSGRNGKWVEYQRGLTIFNNRGMKIGRYQSKPLPRNSDAKIK